MLEYYTNFMNLILFNIGDVYLSILDGILSEATGTSVASSAGSSLIVTIGCKIIYYIKTGGILVVVCMGSWMTIKYVIDGRVEGSSIIFLGCAAVLLVVADDIVMWMLIAADSSEMSEMSVICP